LDSSKGIPSGPQFKEREARERDEKAGIGDEEKVGPTHFPLNLKKERQGQLNSHSHLPNYFLLTSENILSPESGLSSLSFSIEDPRVGLI